MCECELREKRDAGHCPVSSLNVPGDAAAAFGGTPWGFLPKSLRDGKTCRICERATSGVPERFGSSETSPPQRWHFACNLRGNRHRPGVSIPRNLRQIALPQKEVDTFSRITCRYLRPILLTSIPITWISDFILITSTLFYFPFFFRVRKIIFCMRVLILRIPAKCVRFHSEAITKSLAIALLMTSVYVVVV